MEAQGLNCIGYKIKMNLWRPEEVMVRCQCKPCAGALGLCRNLSSTHTLCWHCCLSHEVFLLGQTSRILGHKYHCYFITDCCHMEDKIHYSPLPCSQAQELAKRCWQITQLSSTQRWMPACLPWFHILTVQGTGKAEHHSPPDAANDCPILKPIGGPLGIGISSVYGEQQLWHCNGAV